MGNKLTAKHLEVLLKLGNSKEPIKNVELLPYLNYVSDLIEYNLVNKLKESSELSGEGRRYLDKILDRILKDIQNDFKF